MELSEIQVDDTLVGGMFNLEYIVTGKNEKTIDVKYITEEKVMWGGKWIDEVFEYKNQNPKNFKRKLNDTTN